MTDRGRSVLYVCICLYEYCTVTSQVPRYPGTGTGTSVVYRVQASMDTNIPLGKSDSVPRLSCAVDDAEYARLQTIIITLTPSLGSCTMGEEPSRPVADGGTQGTCRQVLLVYRPARVNREESRWDLGSWKRTAQSQPEAEQEWTGSCEWRTGCDPRPKPMEWIPITHCPVIDSWPRLARPLAPFLALALSPQCET
ncbi:hypothetical protein P170DRAFT_64821 [Aspergillus steynii IBT 23096]|uniref:Uncharacterized protein n=1 Tax=Aspergillus steynii IBT 23096 TaxID=1392250 RepID=A0A2I2FTI1_9EURO|nr:uncharacterized protein P170DRAFT_64821 [Aspergillus steynii IBT 23096]PLB43911.1 hypothetical protein P170DRAFT_64821 [Aspergillus steynii IBT 23096]